MFKRNHITTAIVAGTVLLASATTFAEDVDVQATVSVQNAFSLAQTTALSFGTLRVTQTLSGGAALSDVAELTLPPDGSTATIAPATGLSGAEKSDISVITDGTNGVFAISGAAPNTTLTVTLPASTSLTPPGGGGNSFTVEFDETRDVQIVGGPNDGDLYTTFNFTTAADGTLGFTLGGVLKPSGSSEDFDDTTYTGDYTVDVSY